MIDFLFQPGFLATNAPLVADLSLVLTLLSVLLLTIGIPLIRRHQVHAHRWVQTAAVILNTIVVLIAMIRPLVLYILPELPDRFSQIPFGITAVHAVVGTIGVILGVYVVLRGNNLVPKRMRFKNYKSIMRISYGIYLLATLLGLVVYLQTYVSAV